MDRRRSKRLILLMVLVLAAAGLKLAQRWFDGAEAEDAIAAAFESRRSGVMVEATAVVTRILADDDEGSRHQRFIVELPSGQTLLIAHNIDLAPRVPIEPGDEVAFRGMYEWNDRGGVVHWTHHDPDGDQVGGWIRHRGREYR